MSIQLNWFVLAAISSITASVVSILQKFALKDTDDPISFGIYFQLLVSLIGLPMAIINYDSFPLNFNIIFMVLLMAFFSASGNLLYFFSLKSTEISQVAILTSTSSLWLLPGGFIFFRELPSIYKILGVFLVVLGVFVIYYNKNSTISFGTSQIFALISAVFAGLTGMFDKFLLAIYTVSTYQVLSYFLQALLTASLMPSSVKNIAPLLRFNRTNAVIILCAILLNFGAFSYFSALKIGGEISKVNPILQSSVILTIILGIICFNEKENLLNKVLGTITIFWGVLLIKSI